MGGKKIVSFTIFKEGFDPYSIDTGGIVMPQISIPKQGQPKEAILSDLKAIKKEDADWHQGQMFGLIYEAGKDVEALVKEYQEEKKG